MTDDSEVARIAAGLTKVQRLAVLSAEEIVCGELSVPGSDELLYELALDRLVNDLDGDALTPLGIRVRDHLLSAHTVSAKEGRKP